MDWFLKLFSLLLPYGDVSALAEAEQDGRTYIDPNG
jgi:hypothetical protein